MKANVEENTTLMCPKIRAASHHVKFTVLFTTI